MKVLKSGSLNLLEPSRSVQAFARIVFFKNIFNAKISKFKIILMVKKICFMSNLHAIQDTARWLLHFRMGMRVVPELYTWTESSHTATANLVQCGCHARHRTGLTGQALVCDTAAISLSPLSCNKYYGSHKTSVNRTQPPSDYYCLFLLWPSLVSWKDLCSKLQWWGF